jgi:hypothetical protein
LLSAQFKRLVRTHGHQGDLAASVGLDCSQLSSFMYDRLAIGPVIRPRLAKLGASLGLTEAQCFREVVR